MYILMEKNENENQCSICNRTNTNTIILTCSHGFCSTCLYKQIFYNYSTYEETSFKEEMELTCVICDKGSHMMTKKSIFEFLNATITDSDSQILCKYEHGLKVESFCNKCNWEMCEKCYKQHSLISHFADHQITTDVGIAKVKNTCFKHKEKKLKFQCLECTVPICGICREVEHFQHKVSFIDDYYNSKKQKEIKSIRMPNDNYESFKQNLKNEEKLVLIELKNKSIKTFDRIENQINQLIGLKKDFEIKINNIEDELIKTICVHDRIFEKLYYDINNIRSSDFNNLNLLNKMPGNYITLKFTQAYLENFEKCLQNLEDSTKNIQREVTNIESIDFYKYYEAISIQTDDVENYVISSIVRLSNGNIACLSDSNKILIFDGASDCKLINTINVTAKPEKQMINNYNMFNSNCNRNNYNNKPIYDDFGNVPGVYTSFNCLLSMPEGMLVAACNDNSLKFWNLKNNYQLPTSLDSDQSLQYIITNTKNTFILGFHEGYLYIWGNCDHTKIISCDTLHYLSRIDLSEFVVDNLSLNSLNVMEESYEFKEKISINSHSSCLSVNSHHLAVAFSNDIQIIDFSDQNNVKLLCSLKGHKNKVNSLLYLEEGKFASSSEDLTIKIWLENNNTYICSETIVADTKNFKLLSYKNKKFATISTDGTLKIFDQRFKPICTVFTKEKEFSLQKSTFLTEDNYFITLSANSCLRIYKI